MSKITQAQLDEFISDCRKDIKEHGKENDHCIVFHKTKGFHNERMYVHKIYKNIDEFEKRGLTDMNELEVSWGVTPQLWFYD
jgi:hypothetical protein